MLSTMSPTRVPAVRSYAGRSAPVAPPPLPGVESVGDTPLRLMEAAADAFSDKGFHATTTRDIASRAGLSPAGVYVYFASKEELLFALSERGHVAARDMLVAAAKAADTPSQGLTAILSGFSRWHAEHYRMGRIVQYEFGHLTPPHREVVLRLRKEIDAVVRSVLEEGVRSGEFEVDDVHATTLALMSMCVDVARWYTPGIRRTPDQIGATNARLGLRLVGARGSASTD